MTPTPASAVPPSDQVLRARTPEDLIALAPLLMGFQFEEDVVMITSDAFRQLHARTSLPPCPAPPGWAQELAASLVEPARRNGVRSLAFLIYTDDEGRAGRAWAALRRECARSGIRVLAVLRVDGHRYYPLLARGRVRERGVRYDVSAHPLTVRGVVEGKVVERSRDALVARVAADPAGQRAVAEVLQEQGRAGRPGPSTPAERRRWGERVRELVTRHLAEGTPVGDHGVAELVWAMQDVRVRDAAWVLMRRADADRHGDLWRDVLRRTPEPLVPAPACLFGWASWLAGDGALAWIAVDRCREVDDGCTMAGLLTEVLDGALPPEMGEPLWSWDEGLPPAGVHQ